MQTLKLNSRGEEVKALQCHLNLYPDGIFGKLTHEAVIAFQKSHNLTPDGIVGKWTLAAIQNQKTANSVDTPYALRKTTRPIKRIIIHCSATPEGKDFTVADITRWHKERGYATIGYHYVIYRDGTIHEGRDINLTGAHTEDYNTGSIGICYIGGCDTNGKTAKDTRTNTQKAALFTLLVQLRKLYPTATIHGHREFAKKDCPSFDVKAEYGKL